MNNYNDFNVEDNSKNLKEEIIRYLTFWPWFLISIIIGLSLSFLFLRYAEYKYEAKAKIEILDKAQDSEMSLPTAMTVFNRSMINLENEIGVLGSYSIHKKAVSKLNSNVRFFTKGTIKTTEDHSSQWFNNYDLKFDIDFDSIKSPIIYNFTIFEGNLNIERTNSKDELIKSYSFEGYSTLNKDHDLPFNFSIELPLSVSKIDNKTLIINPVSGTVDKFRSLTRTSKVGVPSSNDS